VASACSFSALLRETSIATQHCTHEQPLLQRLSPALRSLHGNKSKILPFANSKKHTNSEDTYKGAAFAPLSYWSPTAQSPSAEGCCLSDRVPPDVIQLPSETILHSRLPLPGNISKYISQHESSHYYTLFNLNGYNNSGYLSKPLKPRNRPEPNMGPASTEPNN
jgi:hypothetical protein